MTKTQPPEETKLPPSAPFLCGAFESSSLYEHIASDRIVTRAELDAAIAGDRIRWRKRWYLWPFGYGAIVEWRWPKLRRHAANHLFETWTKRTTELTDEYWAEVERIANSGSHAEDIVQAWLDRICKDQAKGQMACWIPAMSGIKEIVFPPNEFNGSSQEFDNLLVTEHGVYVIEVKGWRSIAEDGTGKGKDGTDLGSPIEQSKNKVTHLRAMLGPQVPVNILGVLPNLQEHDVPFNLDARIIVSEGQLIQVLRTAQQRMLDGKGRRIDVEAVRRVLGKKMDNQAMAKISHMMWLAENHPNENALRIKELVFTVKDMGDQMKQPFSFDDRKRRPLPFALALFVALLLYVGLTDPHAYKRHGIEFGAPAQAEPEPAAKPAGKKPAKPEKKANP